jgi:hypothetical protein
VRRMGRDSPGDRPSVRRMLPLLPEDGGGCVLLLLVADVVGMD